MGRRKLPKNCKDWHEDLIRCAEARYIRRQTLGRRDYAQWMTARDLLRASEDHIFVQPTGENKGAVIGIPKKIGPAITQYLQRVVLGDKPVIDPEDEVFLNNAPQVVNANGEQLHVPEPEEVGFEHGPFVQRRKYRDSAYAVLAAMYTLLRPDPHYQAKTAQIESEMRHFTDHDVRYDYRTNRQGAFKAMDQLVEKGLVSKQRGMGFGGGNFYALTLRGLKVCYQLFHVKFTPEVSAAYSRVRPRCGVCEANARGQIQYIGGQHHGALPAPAPQAAGNLGQPYAAAGNAFGGLGGGLGYGMGAGGMHGMGGNGNDLMGDYGLGVGGYDEDGDDPYDDYGGPVFGATGRGGGGGAFGGGAFGGVAFGGGGGHGRPGALVGQKRPAGGDDDDDAHYKLDPDLVREKRLRRFQDLPRAPGHASSSAGKPAAPVRSSGGAPAGAAAYPAPPPAVGGSDSQDPELEAVRLQTLLEYSEEEARRAEQKRAMEDEELQAALAVSRSEQEQLDLAEEWEEWEAASEHSVYDLDFEPGPELEGADEGAGDDYESGEEDEDYQRAVQESLRTAPTPVPAPASVKAAAALSSSSAASPRPTVASKSSTTPAATPAPSARPAVAAGTASRATPAAAREVIELDVPEPHSTTAKSPAPPKDREVIDVTDEPARPKQTPAPAVASSSAGTNSRGGSAARTVGGGLGASCTVEIEILDDSPPDAHGITVPNSSVAVQPLSAQRARSHSQGSNRSSASPSSTPLPGITPRAVARTAPLSAVQELSSSTSPTPSPLPRQSGVKRADSAAPSVGGGGTGGAAREVITLEDSQSQSQSQVQREICSEEVISLLDGSPPDAGSVPHSVAASSRDGGAGKRGLGSMLASCAAQANQREGSVARDQASSNSRRGSTVVRLPLPPGATAHTVTVMAAALPKPVEMEAVPIEARRQVVMMVDTRERFVQNRYRQFYFDIQQRCTAHLPASSSSSGSSSSGSGGAVGSAYCWRTEQEELKLGDIAFAFEAPPAPISTRPAGTSQEQDDHRGACWLTGTMVERKAVTDLISSSAGDSRARCGTARHFTQEMRLRHSGLKRPFMLIEGVTNAANLHAVPLVWRDSDHRNPDVIDSAEALVSYMCAVVARNYAPQCQVRVLQTMSNGTSALLYAALMTVELFLCSTQPATSRKCLRLDAFERYCNSLGANKRGKEAQLRADLLVAGSGGSVVSRELVERVVRRFGSWEALLQVYRLSYRASCSDTTASLMTDAERTAGAELRCALLLGELTVGGTYIDRQALTAEHAEHDAVDGSPAEQVAGRTGDADNVPLQRDSVLVWSVARRKLVSEGFRQEPSPACADLWQAFTTAVVDVATQSRETQLTLSKSMARSYLAQHAALDHEVFRVEVLGSAHSHTGSTDSSGAQSLLIGGAASLCNLPDGCYPYLTLQSADACSYTVPPGQIALRRRSWLTCVAVVSGFDVVEAVVQAYHRLHGVQNSSSGGGGGGGVDPLKDPRSSVAIMLHALQHLQRSLPAAFSSQPRHLQTEQCVLIVEGLLHPTSSMASAVGRLCRVVNTSSPADSTVCLGDGRPALPLRAAREVSAQEAWVVQLFLACASTLAASTNGTSVDGEVEQERAGRQGSEGREGWQVLLAPNAEQTERLLYALLHETQRQSLLLYP